MEWGSQIGLEEQDGGLSRAGGLEQGQRVWGMSQTGLEVWGSRMGVLNHATGIGV